ncbi:MAG: hypothetical protein E7311_01370 [Clostridiales bacterium]|nr:hypothetical protein [Clostridiales bacterium]
MENLYEILEVSKNASPEVIEKAYKTLAKKYHPDVAEDKEKAEKMMKKLNSAYEILSNTQKREEYDYNLEQEDKSKKVQDEQNNSMKYKEYYEEQKQDNISYENMKQNINTNMYNNYYVQEDDYANNLNILKRIRNVQLDRTSKAILIIIFFIIIFAIIRLFSLIGSLFTDNNQHQINNNNSSSTTTQPEQKQDEEHEIDDLTPVNLVNELFEDLKEYDFERINEYLTKSSKIYAYNINTLNKDKIVYSYILNNTDYTIEDYIVTNKQAKVSVTVETFDVANAISEYNKWKKDKYSTGSLAYTSQEEREKVYQENLNKIVEFLEENVNEKVEREITITVLNVEGEWKVIFNFNDIFGTSML